MATAEIMDKCKEKLGIDTDYKLSKIMDISNARLSDYRKGTRVPDEYACFRFAEILGESPSALIARVQAENTKSESKRLFFKSFLTAVGLWIILAVIPVFSDSSLGSAYADGNHAKTRANTDVTTHYTKYYEDLKIVVVVKIEPQLRYGRVHQFDHLPASNDAIAA